MDEKFIEVADALTQSMIDQAIEATRHRAEKPPEGFDGTCECGEMIPEARITLGYYRCVCCQSNIEERQRMYR